MELPPYLLPFLLGLGVFWAVFLLLYREWGLRRYGFSLEGGMLLWRTERGLRFIDRTARRHRGWWLGFGEVGVGCPWGVGCGPGGAAPPPPPAAGGGGGVGGGGGWGGGSSSCSSSSSTSS
jgi:hypothetical protein